MLMLAVLSMTAQANDFEFTEDGCYTFDQEATGPIDCVSTARAVVDPMTGTQHDFECDPAMGLIDGSYAPDHEFAFDPGRSCFHFTSALPADVSVTIRDQAGFAGGFQTLVEALDQGMNLVGSATVPMVKGEHTYAFSEPSGIEWICVTRPSVGHWQEATLDDICVGEPQE